MQFQNPFFLPASQYQRDLDIMRHYQEDALYFLQKQTGKSEEQCRDFLKRSFQPGGKFEFKDTNILYLERGENGDREKKVGTLLAYINDSIQRRDLIAPTGTTYLHPDVLESPYVSYVETNIKRRSVAKKEMFEAMRNKDKVLHAIKKNEQNNKKTSNNSVSGGHVSPSTPLYNPTAHSTLTSNCRTTSGFGNANNEKLLSGNRHYHTAEVTLNNIVSIAANSDYERIQAVMEKYNLHYPTSHEVMACINYSAQLYGDNPKQMAQIKSFVETLTPLECAAFVYTGDLYHIRMYNENVVRQFVRKLSMKAAPASEFIQADGPYCMISSRELVDELAKTMRDIPEDIVNLAVQICPDEFRGKKVSDLVGTYEYIVLCLTAQNVCNTMMEYADFIQAFFVTIHVPASLGYFPDSIRRSALMSDTDSTIFTVQEWVEWYIGDITFDAIAQAVAASMIFLASQTIIHILARMSANFGIVEKYLFKVAMKNEFKFDVFVPTQVAKHYYALIGCQEGNLHEEHEMEIKGVHLKSSNAPAKINKLAENMMEEIMQAVYQGKKLKGADLMKRVADAEREIMQSIQRGQPEFFRRAQVKSAESYTKGPTESNYVFYTMWNEVFGPKYTEAPVPPYDCYRLTLDINSPSETRAWLDGLKDQELADRMRRWMASTGKQYIGSLLVPEQSIQLHGIPEELLPVIGMRRLVADITKVLSLVLETVGIYYTNDKQTRLLSDHY